NNLYSGKTSFPFVGRRRLWFIIAVLLVLGSILVPFIRPVQFSIEFTGGSQFMIVGPSSTNQGLASDAVRSVVPNATTRVAIVNNKDVRVQTDQMSPNQTQDVKNALADAYDVQPKEVADSFIGPAW